MERPPTLRRGRPEDAAVVTELFLQARAAAMPWLRRVRSDRSTRWVFDRVVLVEQEVWVAEREGVVVGFGALHDGWIEHLHVAPEAQGTGVGRALLGRLVERGGPGLLLRTFTRNEHARAFFAGQGFVVEAESDGADNEEHEPALTMLGPGWS